MYRYLKIIIVLFLYIYGWMFYSVLDWISVVSVIFTIYLARKQVYSNIFKRFNLYIFIFVAFTLISSIVNYGLSLDMLLRVIRLLLTFYGGIGIILWMRNNKIENDDVFVFVFWVISFHGLLMSAMYFSPALRGLIYGLANTYSIVNDTYSIRSGFRISGLTYGLSQTSVVQGWGAFIGIYMLSTYTNISKIHRILIIVFLPILFFSVFISGRSGIVITIAITLIYIVYQIINTKDNIYFLTRSLPVIIFFTIIISVSIAWFLSTSFDNESLSYTQFHIKEAFMLLDSGESSTTETLEEMILVPSDFKTLLIGASTFDRSYLNIYTDIGYVRILFYSGLIGSLLYYLPFLFLMKFTLSRDRKYNNHKVVVLLIFLSTLVLHGKEISVYTRNQWSIQTIILMSILPLNSSRLTDREPL